MRIKKSALLIVLLLSVLILSGCGSSPTGSSTTVSYGDVYGTIVDNDNNSVEEATVTISSKEATTGSAGGFTIKDLETGSYTLTATKYEVSTDISLTENTHEYYNTASREISISDGSNTLGDIPLKPKFIVNSLDYYYDSLGFLNFTGKITNNGDEFVDYIEISIKIYNDNDERIGSSYTNMTEVGSGEVVNWEILTTYDGPDADWVSYIIDVDYSVY